MAKVKLGLKNVHYSIVTETTDVNTGAVVSSYSAVKAWPGAVNISVDPQGDDINFYADDGVYFTVGNNNGYSGSFESALIPEDVYTSVFGQTKDANGVVSESKDDVKKYIALMFEFTLDASGRRFILYRCSLTRPSLASATKAESANVQTESVNINATPRPDDGKVRDFVNKGDAAYSGWYSSVYSGGAVVPHITTPESITLADGAEVTLEAVVVPADAVVSWSSADSSVASVGASTGVVTAEGTGNTIITASITVDGVTYTDTTTVIVTE